MDARTPKDLGLRSKLLVDKHAAYVKSFNRIWEGTDSLEFVATEHFWMSGIYWGLSAMAILGRLNEMDGEAVVQWILRCWRPDPMAKASPEGNKGIMSIKETLNENSALTATAKAAATAADNAEMAAAEADLRFNHPLDHPSGALSFNSSSSEHEKERCRCLGGGVRSDVRPRQYIGGGFGASERNDPHLLATCSAVQILALYDRLHLVDADKIAKYVGSLQNDDGSFCGDVWGEVDTRFTYCAFLTLSILNRLHPTSHPLSPSSPPRLLPSSTHASYINLPLACQFIARCRNFDGGFGCTPGAESHSGQVFTCVAALSLARRLDLLDIDLLSWWLAERQTPSGGLNGRPEKLQDVCYSWWCLSSLSAMGRLHWVDREELKRFILFCQDEEDGGISDRPDDMVDVYHTFFGIAGLSLLGEEGLEAFDPVWALPTKVVERLRCGRDREVEGEGGKEGVEKGSEMGDDRSEGTGNDKSEKLEVSI